MQAIYLDDHLLKQKLARDKNSTEEAHSFMRRAVTHLIKVKGVSGALFSSLKNTLSDHGVSYCNCPDFCAEDTIILSAAAVHFNTLVKALQAGGGPFSDFALAVQKALEGALQQTTGSLSIGSRQFKLNEKTYIMGIINVTPDSFSDGGRFYDFDKALAQAYQMAEEGADVIDIGGESTRPGYEKAYRVSAEEEMECVLPLIKTLKSDQGFKLPLSIDTYKAETAKRALDCGADLLNDVWGFKEDKNIARVAAKYNVPVCLMHNKRNTIYDDLISDVIGELEESVNLALEAGVKKERIIIDPGIGFGKNYEQNLEVMFHLRELKALGYPLLLGTSRKSMIGKTLDLPLDERIEGTAATVACSIFAGADFVRVHDVKEMWRVVKMTDAMVRR